MLNKLAKEINQNAVEHGWWEEERTFGDIVALCHSELSEALEEHRNGKPNAYFITPKENGFSVSGLMCEVDIIEDLSKWNGEKLEGKAVELADCIIRILDYCGQNNIDIDAILQMKHEYNKTRLYRHGDKKL